MFCQAILINFYKYIIPSVLKISTLLPLIFTFTNMADAIFSCSTISMKTH